jgi:hypothetical protein
LNRVPLIPNPLGVPSCFDKLMLRQARPERRLLTLSPSKGEPTQALLPTKEADRKFLVQMSFDVLASF